MVIPSILSRASLYFDAKAPNQASPGNAAPAPVVEGVNVTVSQRAESLARQVNAVDQAKVESLKRRFSDGSYNVNPLQLAQAMLAKG